MASGVEHREDLAAKMARERVFLLVVQVLVDAQEDAFFFQGRQSCSRRQSDSPSATFRGTIGADGGELLARRHAVGAGADGDAGVDLLLQPADADHEELVEVGRRRWRET